MKQLIQGLGLCMAMLFGLSAQAQTLKFGHINSADLIKLMPETRQSDSTLKKFGESLDSQLKTMGAEYQRKLGEYQSKRDSFPDAIRQIKEKEIMDLQQRIDDFQQTAQESIQQKKEEIYGPILKKADQAIRDVAKEKGYSYIFDTSAGTVLYAQDSDNIMPLIKAKLGLK